jgi:predicted RNA-binding Zn ribbon-like protein
MSHVFVGSHPAVDFLNTVYGPEGRKIETIGNGKDFLEWLQAAGLLDTNQAARLQRKLGARGLDTAASEARELRDWARTWLARWRSAPTRAYAMEIETLNRHLSHRVTRQEVVRTSDGLHIVERPQLESAKDLLALLAEQIAKLVSEEDPALFKSCAGSDCTLWFLDRTKAHRRMFCSPATCGNRAKVAAFRERQRK